jgi:hypothetical protein
MKEWWQNGCFNGAMPQHGLLPESLLPDFHPAYCRIPGRRLTAGNLSSRLNDVVVTLATLQRIPQRSIKSLCIVLMNSAYCDERTAVPNPGVLADDTRTLAGRTQKELANFVHIRAHTSRQLHLLCNSH